MKQFLTAVLLSMALAFGQQAEAQQLRYYYYPASNAYYDVANQAYIYPSGGRPCIPAGGLCAPG